MIIANEYRVSFWDEEIVLELGSIMVCTTL